MVALKLMALTLQDWSARRTLHKSWQYSMIYRLEKCEVSSSGYGGQAGLKIVAFFK